MSPRAAFRSVLLGLALAPLLAAGACAAAEPGRSSTGRVESRERARTVQAGETVVIALGETVEIASPKRTLTFTRVVQDSRCPRGVTCVWAGQAVVEVRVGGGEAPAEPVHLAVGTAAPETVAGALRLTALGLDPWPRAEAATRPEDYRLRLAIAASQPPAAAR
jgi:hypothetical protein